MDVLLIVLGLAVACFIGWKLLLGAVKGVSKAVTAGIAEGRGGIPAPAPSTQGGEDASTDLQDELIMATYQLGVSELQRDPTAHGYDPDESVFKPSDAEVSSGTISMKTMGAAIAKMSPVNPARLALEEVAEQHVRDNMSAANAEDLRKLHEKQRTLAIIEVGAKIRARRT